MGYNPQNSNSYIFNKPITIQFYKTESGMIYSYRSLKPLFHEFVKDVHPSLTTYFAFFRYPTAIGKTNVEIWKQNFRLW